ncbi:MAG TPA: pantoate--beta-alanine ligase [Dehalococcoidales bacterium]|nr:pantoate--beta-alanine ligase [Dehalococcoidales bacterium]
MRIIETLDDMKRYRRSLNGTVGFVPTMGYLHAGHISLITRSKKENTFNGASIFVNPTQFGPSEDFDRYPRDYPRDFAMLEKAGTDFVFLPTPGEVYPAGFNTWVEVQGVTAVLEGAVRPGHFRGVATVVAKLFNMVEPNRAYFGQKDAQQCVVIKKMAKDLNLNVEVIISPTIREPDGLAMSSRNVYLSAEERSQAPVLNQALELAQKMLDQSITDTGEIRQAMETLIKQKPLARIEYISLADALTLQELPTARAPMVISLAVRFGKTRLIDNRLIE